MTSPLSSASPKLCLIGAGNMGGAMLGGWLAAGHDPKAITVIDPKPPEPMAKLIADSPLDIDLQFFWIALHSHFLTHLHNQ